MPRNRFRVRVTKDHLVFSAAHFITYNGDICERLHGHNWRASVEVEGPLDENQYVYDFIALRDHLQQLVNELDHRVLLPRDHPRIEVQVTATEVTARFRDRRWVFPLEDCRILPIANTTAELIAEWLGAQLLERLGAGFQKSMTQLCIRVEENFGQWAECEIPLA
jgi:6-pyruvoyltetrahydropterin/6-carboxytetrahydropterin synthase